jgi:hypothetical protein
MDYNCAGSLIVGDSVCHRPSDIAKLAAIHNRLRPSNALHSSRSMSVWESERAPLYSMSSAVHTGYKARRVQREMQQPASCTTT